MLSKFFTGLVTTLVCVALIAPTAIARPMPACIPGISC
jgi:hypothetical protein